MDISEIRLTNLRKLVEVVGGRPAFAKKMDMAYAQATSYVGKNPTRSIGDVVARRAETVFGLPKDWLDHTHASEDIPTKFNSELSIQEKDIEIISDKNKKIRATDGIPMDQVEYIDFEFWDDETPVGPNDVIAYFYKEVVISSGPGMKAEIVEDHGGRKVRFGKRSLKNNQIDPESVVCAMNTGNSMASLIQDGAMLMIDKSKNYVKDNRIFAFDHGGVFRCKYLFNRPHGGLLLRSFNREEHPDEILTAEEVERDIHLIGWVFDWSKMQKW